MGRSERPDHDSRRLDEPSAGSLEQLVPANRFCRHMEAQLDLASVREWARERYAERGQPNFDSAVSFELQLGWDLSG
jgi:hypothetical protein